MAAVGARAPLAESSFESNLQLSNDVALLLSLSLFLSVPLLSYFESDIFDSRRRIRLEWRSRISGKGVCEFELEIELIAEQV